MRFNCGCTLPSLECMSSGDSKTKPLDKMRLSILDETCAI
jgi:hypothetical protein